MFYIIFLLFLLGCPNEVYCECIDLVVYDQLGNLSSTVGERWSSSQRGLYTLNNIPPYYLGIIVGLVLSDGNLQFRGKGRLRFGQSLKHFPYFWFVFNLLSHFCQSLPHLEKSTRNGVLSLGSRFNTRSLPFLTELYDMFYVKGIKGIPFYSLFMSY